MWKNKILTIKNFWQNNIINIIIYSHILDYNFSENLMLGETFNKLIVTNSNIKYLCYVIYAIYIAHPFQDNKYEMLYLSFIIFCLSFNAHENKK